MLDTLRPFDTFESEVEAFAEDRDRDLVRHLIHEDGSHTFIYPEEDLSFSSPRDWDGNVACLVVEHRNYRDLDDADNGIEEARERWGDEHSNVERYVRMFRPDIAHYEPRWSVNGCSQSDWSHGYGYVTRAALALAGYGSHTKTLSGTMRMRAKSMFDSELAIYQMWFEGDVYRALHVSPGAEQYAIGDQGGYLTGYHDYDTDSCGGFLGYEDMKDIGQHFTASPVIEEVYP